MYRKLNSKKLLLLLVVLLAVVALVVILDSKKGNRSFRAEMTDADTSKISRIVIFPKASGEDRTVELNRTKEGWKVRSGKKEFATDEMMINGLLTTIADMKTLRVVANDKSKWKEFEVTDSAAVRAKIYTGKKLKSELYIGRFNYQQPKNRNPYDYYNQQRGTMSTYVRLAGEKTVYLVEGFLAMTFNRSPEDFRDKTVIRLNKDNLTRLSFSYPADSSFTLSLENGEWMINGLTADSSLTENYLNSITLINHADISDEADPVSEPVYSLTINGNNFQSPVIIKAYPADTVNRMFISSSQNKDVYFSDPEEDLKTRIFIGKDRLLGN